jgi:hypothetical protein
MLELQQQASNGGWRAELQEGKHRRYAGTGALRPSSSVTHAISRLLHRNRSPRADLRFSATWARMVFRSRRHRDG